MPNQQQLLQEVFFFFEKEFPTKECCFGSALLLAGIVQVDTLKIEKDGFGLLEGQSIHKYGGHLSPKMYVVAVDTSSRCVLVNARANKEDALKVVRQLCVKIRAS